MSNLATDTQTISKLSTKSSTATPLTKSSPDKSDNKQNLFQNNTKSNTQEGLTLSKEHLTSAGMNNAMTATLAETPCKDEHLHGSS